MDNKKKKNFLNMPDEYINSLPVKTQLQLPFIFYGNLIFAIAFAFLGSFLIYQSGSWLNSTKYVIVMVGVLSILTAVWFITSMILVKSRKVNTGAWFSTVGFIFATIIILDFVPPSTSALTYYRSACFAAVMAICNEIVSLKRRQLNVFFAASLAAWAASIAICFNKTLHDFAGTISGIGINTIAIITANLIISLMNKFNLRIIDSAVKAEKESKENLESITHILSESKNGLDVGQKLYDETQKAQLNITELNNIYRIVSENSMNLTQDSASVRTGFDEVMDQSKLMKDSVSSQNRSIDDTSKGLSSISEKLGNLSSMARQRSDNISQLLTTIESEKTLISSIVDEVSQVQESSEGIASFVNTVDSIAEQTGLLAMNASIEAAHAGINGKGFSVIAQEIRKLSNETKKNATQISEELARNAEVVKSATQSVGSFQKYIQETTVEMKSTLQMIEQLLNGIQEIDSETGRVMGSLSNAVDQAKETGESVDTVARKLTDQSATIKDMEVFVTELKNSIANMNVQMKNIRSVLDSIETEASKNKEVSQKINGFLE